MTKLLKKGLFWIVLVIFLGFSIFILIILKEKPGQNGFDFFLNIDAANKEGFKTSYNYIEDQAYLLSFQNLHKNILKNFSYAAIVLNRQGIRKCKLEKTIKDGGLLLTNLGLQNVTYKYEILIKKVNEENYYQIQIEGANETKITVKKIEKKKTELTRTLSFPQELYKRNAIYIVFISNYLVIMNDKLILLQIKDEALDRNGRIDYEFNSNNAIKLKSSLKFIEFYYPPEEYLQFLYLNAKPNEVADHCIAYSDKNWNNLYLEEFESFKADNSNLIHRLMLDGTTRPSIYFTSGSRLEYDVKIPLNSVMEFSLALNPHYISPIGSYKFSVYIEESSDKNNKKKYEYNLSTFTNITTSFYNIKVLPKQFYGKKAKITFMFETSKNEKTNSFGEKGIVALASPRLYIPRTGNEYNVILICLDTLSARHMTFYGYQRNTSQNIDSFAAENTRFVNAFSNSSWTLPSHISLFSSLYPYETGYFKTRKHFNLVRIARNIKFLTNYLKESGYKTSAITGGANISSRYGFDQGFDSYYEKKDWDTKDVGKEIDEAIEWIKQNKNHKFFLFFHTYEIHAPYIRGSFLKEIPKNADKKTIAIAKYDSEILYTDQQIGRFIKWLKEVKLIDSTLLIVLSDHGENFDILPKDQLSGMHGVTLYDTEIHIPLIIGGPSEFKGGKKINSQVSLIDVTPTVLDYLNIEMDSQIRGKSLLPIIRGEKQGERSIYAEGVLWCPYEIKALRYPDYKFIHNLIVPGKSESGIPGYELYCLEKDYLEKNNIVGDEATRIKQFTSMMKKINESIKTNIEKLTKVKGLRTIDDKLLNQLKALNYIN